MAAIKHEAIPGYMPAMTMQFPIEDPEILQDLQVGDKVEGNLVVGDEDWKLTDLIISEMAEAPDMVLDASSGEPVLRERRPVLKPGEEVPDFTVTTQDGRPLRLSELRGNVVVLTFIYTRCPLPDFCPLMDKKFAELSRRLEAVPGRAERVRLLSVSFDPEHDTPEVLRRHARLAGAEPPLWTFAVASHDELRKVAESLGLTYGATGDEIIHSLSTAVIDGQGRLARLETGNRWDVGEVSGVVSTLLRPER